jgi:VCBS repeat-containing protein
LIVGGAGDDFNLRGEGGDDTIIGGAGADYLRGDDGNDFLSGLTDFGGGEDPGNVDGADTLEGGGGNDVLRGNSGADTLRGGDGNDNLRGDAGNDYIDGGAGTDGAGYRFDELALAQGASFNASAVGTAATVALADGRGGTDTLVSVEYVIVTGSSLADTLTGSDGGDQIIANDGNDVIDGGAGDDFNLQGGAGDDTLTGGAGNDVFAFNIGPALGTDRITDFSVGDVLDFFYNSGSPAFALTAITSGDTADGIAEGEVRVGTPAGGSTTLRVGTGGGNAVTIVLTGGYTPASFEIANSATDGILRAVVNSNFAPATVDDSFNGTEDTPLSGNVLANDSDAENDALTATLLVQAANGTVALAGDGSFTYTPNANANGADSFVYQVSDVRGGSASATATLSIAAVNDVPLALDDSYRGSEDTPLTGNVLANDSDVDGGSLTATLISDPTKGLVSLNADGSFTYTPNANANGADSFVYQVSDGQGGSATATATLSIAAVNDAPTAADASAGVTEDSIATASGTLPVADVDGDALTTSLVSSATGVYGVLTLNVNGSYSYQLDNVRSAVNDLNTGEQRQDRFTYRVSDGQGGTATATLTVTVNGRDDTRTGTAGTDVLSGGGGVDTIFGLGGNDQLHGCAGNDVLDGGSGYDGVVYRYDLTGAGAGVAFAADVNIGVNAGDYAVADEFGGVDTLSDIEYVAVTGTSFGDTLTGSVGNDLLAGGGGNDLLAGEAGNDSAVYASGVFARQVADFNNGGGDLGWTVEVAPGDTDILVGIEFIRHAGGRYLLIGGGGFADVNAALAAQSKGDA